MKPLVIKIEFEHLGKTLWISHLLDDTSVKKYCSVGTHLSSDLEPLIGDLDNYFGCNLFELKREIGYSVEFWFTTLDVQLREPIAWKLRLSLYRLNDTLAVTKYFFTRNGVARNAVIKRIYCSDPSRLLCAGFPIEGL